MIEGRNAAAGKKPPKPTTACISRCWERGLGETFSTPRHKIVDLGPSRNARPIRCASGISRQCRHNACRGCADATKTDFRCDVLLQSSPSLRESFLKSKAPLNTVFC